jgi:hypothetical protein
MKTNLSILALTAVATSAVTAARFVTHAGAHAGAAANTLGVSRTDAAVGQAFSVDVIGTAVVEAGGAIAAGAAVETDAQGRAVTKNAGPTVARLAPGESAVQAGDLVEVILIAN